MLYFYLILSSSLSFILHLAGLSLSVHMPLLDSVIFLSSGFSSACIHCCGIGDKTVHAEIFNADYQPFKQIKVVYVV
jgi:hypothetical protein